MTKRIHIQESFDYQYFVIGIASDEPIWKLCWQINQNLQVNLIKRELDDLQEEKDGSLAGELIPVLFDQESLDAQIPDFYEDLETYERLEVALFQNKAQSIPKEAKLFRYIFLLRAAGEKKPDLDSFLNPLNGLSFVISAVDITHIKNIKQIFL